MEHLAGSTQVKGGYDAIIHEIVRLKPDFVTFSEVRNYHNRPLYRRLLATCRNED